MDNKKTLGFVSDKWDKEIIPQLSDYIRIPNQSPMFDKNWANNGHMDAAVDLAVKWVKSQNVNGLNIEVVRLPGRTPLVFTEIAPSEAENKHTIFMYGHLDKQPPMEGKWLPGLGPYTPVIRDGKLYGRGGADDGYAIFAAVTSIKAIQEQGGHHARIVIVVECCEESGSPDLPFYIEHLKPRLGTPELIVCLDSGCGTYDQFWVTTSLRGLIGGTFKVQVMEQACHSGVGSGVFPSSFRILRHLLSRIEDELTGEMKLPELFAQIPDERTHQAQNCADVLTNFFAEYNTVSGLKPVNPVIKEAMLNRTWRPALSVTGVEGIPSLENAGNVLRTHTSVKLSIRIPPLVDPAKAAAAIKTALEKDPPYGAKVEFDCDKKSAGWSAPLLAPWLSKSLEAASQTYFAKPANFIGEGGSIPFMFMLGEMFPQAQFCVTGLLGPQNNAHGPNEMLNIEFGKKVNACVVNIVQDHYAHFSKAH